MKLLQIFFAILVLTVTSQGQTTLVSGQDIVGNFLPTNRSDRFEIQATAGASIRAALGFPANESPEPTIEILGPDGASLGSDVNASGDGANVAVIAPTSGTYTIILSETNNDESSTYNASVVVGGASLTAAADNFVDQPSGADFTGVLQAGDLDAISVEATAGASIRAALGFPANESPEPTIEILGPDGASLDSDINASGDGANVAVIAPASGTYTIILSETNNDESSTYNASVVVGGASLTAAADNFVDQPSGADFTGVLQAGDLDAISVGATAGASIRAALGFPANESPEPTIEILGPDGASLDSDINASGDGANVAVIAPTSGTYTIILSETNNDESSTYNASVVVGGAPLATVADNFVDQPSGADFTGVLQAGDLDAISVEATAGASIRAALGFPANGSPEPTIEILGPDGASLDSDINASGDGADVAVIAPTSGTYTIILSETNNDESSTYNASVVVGGASLATAADNFVDQPSGADFTGVLQAGDLDAISVEATAGASIRAALGFPANESPEPTIEILGPDGSSLDNDINASGDGADVAVIAPTSGTYTVILSETNNDESSTYNASVFISPTNFIAQPSNTFLQNNVSVAQTLKSGDSDIHVVGGRVGDQTTVTLEEVGNTSFSPQLEIFDGNGSVILVQSVGTFQIALANSGNYFLRIFDQNSDQSGSYRLIVSGFTGSATTQFVGEVPDLFIERVNSEEVEVSWASQGGIWILRSAETLEFSDSVTRPTQLLLGRQVFRGIFERREFFRLERRQ